MGQAPCSPDMLLVPCCCRSGAVFLQEAAPKKAEPVLRAALQGWFNDEVEARNALANLPVVQEKLKVDRSEVIWGRPPGANWFERGVGETPNINWLV